MTPLRFEAAVSGRMGRSSRSCSIACTRRRATTSVDQPRRAVPGERIAALYRRACEHLALARARSYPAYMLDRLERLTADAHQVIYQRREFGLAHCVRHGRGRLPARRAAGRAVRLDRDGDVRGADDRARRARVLAPELILSVVNAETAAQFEQMYSPSAESHRPHARRRTPTG